MTSPASVLVADSSPARLAALKRSADAFRHCDKEIERALLLAQEFTQAAVALLFVPAAGAEVFHHVVSASSADGLLGVAKTMAQTVVATGEVLQLGDAGAPVLQGEPRGAFLGLPIWSHEGFIVATIAVADVLSRSWTPGQRLLLEELATSLASRLSVLRARQEDESTLVAANAKLSAALGWTESLVWEAEVDCSRGAWDWKFEIYPSGLYYKLCGERIPPQAGLWYKFNSPDQSEMDERARDAILSGKSQYQQEFRIVLATETRWIRETVSIQNTERGLYRLYGVAVDITDRKQLEADVRRNEALMRQFATHAPAAVAMFDREMRYLVASRRWLSDFDLPADVIGRCHYDLFPDLPEAWKEAHRRGLAGKIISSLGDKYVSARGEVRWISWRVQPWNAVDGTVGGLFIFAEDVTNRRKLEQQLADARDEAVKASQAKSDFLASMSHEIRTPMNGVIGMTSALLASELTPGQRQKLNIIGSSGAALVGILDDILDFSKIEAGKMRLESRPFDIGALYSSVLELMAPKAGEKMLEFAAEIEPGLEAHVLGDAGRIRQVILNLVSNAIKFTDRGEVVSTLYARVSEVGRLRIRIEVTDTGIGIGDETKRRLFSAFEQGEQGTARRYGGTGLGLAISRKLIDMMGGEIGCESQVGRGSSFWFEVELPCTHYKSGTVPRGLALGSVLIAPWGTQATRVTAKMITFAGYKVTAPDRTEHFLAKLSEAGERWTAVVVSDCIIKSDAATRTQLIELVKKKGCPLVLIGEGIYRGPAIDFPPRTRAISKPARYDELIQAIQESGVAEISSLDPAPSSVAPLGTSLNLLLADDSAINQIVGRAVLETLGHKVEVVDSGAAVIERLRENHYDIVLLDCQMPGMDGYETTRQIRIGAAGESKKTTRIVAVTAYAMPADRMKCLAAGMNDYIAKPITREEMERLLHRAL